MRSLAGIPEFFAKKMIRKNDSLLRIVSRYPVKFPNIILSDFKRSVGEVADVISFQKEFLRRKTLSQHQIDCYRTIWGENGGVWGTSIHELVMLVGMKGGKNFWCEGDIAYTCYFISCLNNPHAYFSKITRRKVPYTYDAAFDIVIASLMGKDHSRRVLLDGVKNAIRNTRDPKTGEKWFIRHANLKDDNKMGCIQKSEIRFPVIHMGNGGLRIMSFSSKANAPEGYHILRFYADELSRLPTKHKYRTAKKLHTLGIFNTSISFPNKVGKVITWGYPNGSKYDLVVERYELITKKKLPGYYAIKASTFNFNPTISPESLQDELMRDRARWNRIYECNYSENKISS
ncbi:MAG: hypothetical protein RDU14_15400 [Melioribacteraceae bacterium]|nr:hypothetical protein [Melioribacteraceae bacterium]